MRYLELAELSSLNNLLTELHSDDGSKITGRVECYSCKAAGKDKKLLKKLAQKYPDGISDELFYDLSVDDTSLQFIPSSPGGSTPPISFSATEKQLMPLKLFYFLVSTMNLMFPDYDFSDVSPSIFEKLPVVNHVITQVNSTIFNTGANKNYNSFSEFTRRMWDCIDEVIELHESDIYSFVPGKQGQAEIDDPFWDKGSIWAINYFFWNKKLKRLLVLQMKCINPLNPDGEFFEYPISQRSGYQQKMELSSKLKAMKFMKRKEVPDEVKQKEKAHLDLANRNHWTIESGTPIPTQSSLKFNVEYDTAVESQSRIQASTARRSFGGNSKKQ